MGTSKRETRTIKHYSCMDNTCNATMKVIFTGKSKPCICPNCGADLVEISGIDFALLQLLDKLGI